uniref:Uncharacterized protein n=1 Tax=Anguilla anguilla TaxID=7936 RepID=A0A0E9PQH5_ANGAN
MLQSCVSVSSSFNKNEIIFTKLLLKFNFFLHFSYICST